MNIEIRVKSLYRPEESDPDKGVYTFTYTVSVTNRDRIGAQLISRHWFIEDGIGETREVQGLGVIGQQPLLEPGQTFQYTSGCRLASPSGRMHGSYFFVSEDASRFDAQIPAFELQMPRTLH